MTNLYRIFPRLTTAEMEHVTDEFVKHAVRRQSDFTETEQQRISQWIKEVSLIVPTYILRPDSFSELVRITFSDEAIQTYVLMLQFSFFTAVGVESQTYIDSLVQNLVDGLCVEGPDTDYSALPVEVSKSTSLAQYRNQSFGGWKYKLLSWWTGYKAPHYSLFLLLRNNAWLVVVLLLILVGQESEPVGE